MTGVRVFFFFTGRACYELTIGRPDIFRALTRKVRNRSTLDTSTPIYFPTFQVAIEGIKTCSCMMNQLTCNLQCCLLPIPTKQLSFLTVGSELLRKKYNNFAIVPTMRSQLKYERRRSYNQSQDAGNLLTSFPQGCARSERGKGGGGGEAFSLDHFKEEIGTIYL